MVSFFDTEKIGPLHLEYFLFFHGMEAASFNLFVPFLSFLFSSCCIVLFCGPTSKARTFIFNFFMTIFFSHSFDI